MVNIFPLGVVKRAGKSKYFSRSYLSLGVDVVLLLAPDDGPPLIGIVQVGLAVANHTRRACIYQCLDTSLLTSLDDAAGTANIDLLKELLAVDMVVGSGRGRVDHDIGLEVLDGRGQAVDVGDVALAVDGARVAVPLAAQVDDGDFRGGPGVDGLVDDMVAKEAIAANDEHAAEVASFLLGHDCRRDGGERLTGGREAGRENLCSGNYPLVLSWTLIILEIWQQLWKNRLIFRGTC